MSEIERCTPGRGHFMRFGDSQCECGEKRVYRNFGAQTVSSEPAPVCPHCRLPAVLPEVCSLEIHEAIEAGITEAWELFDAGRQHEAKHRLVPVADDAARHTGDCRRWRLVTGHRREYQGSHACTCGASSQREEPPT